MCLCMSQNRGAEVVWSCSLYTSYTGILRPSGEDGLVFVLHDSGRGPNGQPFNFRWQMAKFSSIPSNIFLILLPLLPSFVCFSYSKNSIIFLVFSIERRISESEFNLLDNSDHKLTYCSPSSIMVSVNLRCSTIYTNQVWKRTSLS